MSLQTGWLSPMGDFYECDEYDHYKKALEIIDLFDYAFNEQKSWPDDCLIAHGWVHITYDDWAHKFRLFWNKTLSLAQEDFLLPYCEVAS